MKIRSSADNSPFQQEWEITYEGIQRVLAESPIAASRFGISMDGVQIAG